MAYWNIGDWNIFQYVLTTPLFVYILDTIANQRIFATVSFILVIVLIGLPMWWKTTEVSRVPLPYDGIKALSDVPITVSGTVAVYTSDPERADLLVAELRSGFANKSLYGLLQLRFTPIVLARNSTDEDEPKTSAELQMRLKHEHPIGVGDFLFMEWPGMTKDDGDVLVTNDRMALISKYCCE